MKKVALLLCCMVALFAMTGCPDKQEDTDSLKTYTVTFWSWNLMGTPQWSTTTQTYTEGNPITYVCNLNQLYNEPVPPPNPTLGITYRQVTFLGWFHDKEFNIAWIQTDRVNQNLVLYGKYRLNTYTWGYISGTPVDHSSESIIKFSNS